MPGGFYALNSIVLEPYIEAVVCRVSLLRRSKFPTNGELDMDYLVGSEQAISPHSLKE